MYQSLFYPGSHTPETLGSITREPPILSKQSKNGHCQLTRSFNIK
jgi:hypothetical protein